ncbi:MAG: ribokinase [Pseudomonadota bacterium]
MSRRVVVVGSVNVDYTFTTARLPQLGETVAGDAFAIDFGGKGANQAVAAARLGADVDMLGCIGADAAGKAALESMAADGVDTSAVAVVAELPTGSAGITVDRAGNNSIVVVAGANACVDSKRIATWTERIRAADTLLLQLEVPTEAVVAAARAARAATVRVILDPAPLEQPLPSDICGLVDLLTPNESEAALLLGRSADSADTAYELAQRYETTCLLTCGAAGCVVATNSGAVTQYSAQPATVRSTVAAGDTFNGALAVALAENHTLERAIDFAQRAAALSVAHDGAQRSMPYRHQLPLAMATE